MAIKVSKVGDLELVTNNGSIIATTRFCNAKDGRGIILAVHYVDFEVKDEDLSSIEINNLKMEMIQFYVKNFYNNMLFRSSTKQPDKLYKYIDNVKGKDFVLVPRLTILN